MGFYTPPPLKSEVTPRQPMVKGVPTSVQEEEAAVPFEESPRMMSAEDAEILKAASSEKVTNRSKSITIIDPCLPKQSYIDHVADGGNMLLDAYYAFFMRVVYVVCIVFGWPLALLSWFKNRK